MCRKADKWGDSKFCCGCGTVAKYSAPMLVPVPEDNETYDDGAW